MSMSILVTNGGPHPADKWAELTAKQILDLIQVAEPNDDQSAEQADAAAVARRAKRDLFPKLATILEGSHKSCQDTERAELSKAKGARRLGQNIDPLPHVHATLPKILNAMTGTPFEDHFKRPEVQDVLVRMIGQHKANIMHIERCYFADRNAEAPEAKAFRQKHPH